MGNGNVFYAIYIFELAGAGMHMRSTAVLIENQYSQTVAMQVKNQFELKSWRIRLADVVMQMCSMPNSLVQLSAKNASRLACLQIWFVPKLFPPKFKLPTYRVILL